MLWQAERRGRLTPAQRIQALSTPGELPNQIDEHTAATAFGAISALASSHGLPVHDVSYLELALRQGLPLASLDRMLCQAALAIGVTLVLPDGPSGIVTA